jgi:hypothetical protein
MKLNNIFSASSIFSLCIALMIGFTSCNRGSEYGPKEGEEESGISSESDESEAYGLEPDDLTFEDEEGDTGNEYPADDDYPRNDVVAGEDNEAMEVEYGQADTAYDETQAMYPSEKIKDETNLNSNDPMKLQSDFRSVKKKKLLATLNSRRTSLENQIRELEKDPGNAEDSSVLKGNIEKLKLYRAKIDREITKVREAKDQRRFEEVAESAQAALKGSGALMQEENMRIQQGY